MTYDTVKKITAVVLCGSFALGAAAGVACAGISSGIGEELGPRIVNAVAGHKILPLRAFAGCLWPVFAAIASGLTVYCRGIYPGIFFLRGMNSAYAVFAVCSGLDRGKGLVAAVSLFGLKNLLLLSALLFLCMDAYAKTMGGKRRPEGEQCYVPDSGFIKRSIGAVVLASCAALVTVYFSPWLAAAVI